jgi:hypothetical protein
MSASSSAPDLRADAALAEAFAALLGRLSPTEIAERCARETSTITRRRDSVAADFDVYPARDYARLLRADVATGDVRHWLHLKSYVEGATPIPQPMEAITEGHAVVGELATGIALINTSLSDRVFSTDEANAIELAASKILRLLPQFVADVQANAQRNRKNP